MNTAMFKGELIHKSKLMPRIIISKIITEEGYVHGKKFFNKNVQTYYLNVAD